MRTTIDKAGRVVIPKPIREALGLAAGADVDIEIDGVSVRMDVVASETRLQSVDGLLVIGGDDAAAPLTVDDVRKLRLDLQR